MCLSFDPGFFLSHNCLSNWAKANSVIAQDMGEFKKKLGWNCKINQIWKNRYGKEKDKSLLVYIKQFWQCVLLQVFDL